MGHMKTGFGVRQMQTAAAIAVAGLLSACTTSTGGSALETASFAPMPDLAFAPVPASKPETPEAQASLAAAVEADTETLAAAPVSFAPASGETDTAKAITKAVPDEAIEVAMAKPEKAAPVKGSARERECLMRAMYFESNRSSPDGLLAVGTVVMHRVAHGAWGKSVCGVVGAHKQFAPGVLTRRMQGDTTDLARLADAILAGKRHPKLAKNVMFFHVAGMKFPYKNMRYVHIGGGNTFYYKASRKRRT
jgi:spore germination cell wall hydrolase CwlJ-like protein